jgi:tetratricopeptide (TPR) repeat protein
MIAVAPLVITLILSTLTVSAPAGAIDPEAKQHLERGLAGYTAKDYAGAIKDLRLAYALDPRPEILFAWAQAERLYGRCSQASKLYDRFLKSKPSAQQAAAARTGIERCEGQPDTTPGDPEDVEQPAPQPAQEQPEQPAAAAAPPPPPRPRVDAVGLGLLGVGVALGAVGGGLLGAGERKAKQLGDVATYDEYADGSGPVRTLRIAGGVLAGVGGALIVGGLVKLLVHRRHDRRDVAFWTDPRGAGVLVRLRF